MWILGYKISFSLGITSAPRPCLRRYRGIGRGSYFAFGENRPCSINYSSKDIQLLKNQSSTFYAVAMRSVMRQRRAGILYLSFHSMLMGRLPLWQTYSAGPRKQ